MVNSTEDWNIAVYDVFVLDDYTRRSQLWTTCKCSIIWDSHDINRVFWVFMILLFFMVNGYLG